MNKLTTVLVQIFGSDLFNSKFITLNPQRKGELALEMQWIRAYIMRTTIHKVFKT